MSNTFIIPAGIKLTVGGQSLSIKHDGDLVLEQTLGRKLGRVEVTGDADLRCHASGILRAGGTVTLHEGAEAEQIQGDVVIIPDGAVVRARSIVGHRKVVIGAARLAVDVIAAPEVELHTEARGRVRVLDTHSELGPTKVRGCLSLEDYELDFGGVEEFLRRRAVAPVSPLPEPQEAQETGEFGALTDGDGDEDDTESVQVADVQDAVDALASGAFPPLADEPLPAFDVPAPAGDRSDETTIEPTPAPTLDAEPVPTSTSTPARLPPRQRPEPAAQPVAPTQARPGRSRTARQAARAWSELESAYGEGRLPGPVAELGALLEEGRTSGLGDDVDRLWIETLQAHVAMGSPPPVAATLAFHSIRSLAA